tara:strand:- start:584 stop:1042 length:459 start_codon:yes stop_codon:yes gene_type:complete
LAAAALDSRLAAVGLVVTLLAACVDTSVAVVAAIIHVAVVVALGPDSSNLPAIAAGLLGGMLLTPWALSATLTWAIVVVASVVTAFELGASLWYALIPVGLVSVLLGIITYGLWKRVRQEHAVPKRDALPTLFAPRRHEAQLDQDGRAHMFV